MKFALYFGVLFQGKMAKDNGLMSISSVKVAVTEEILIINTAEFKLILISKSGVLPKGGGLSGGAGAIPLKLYP